MTTPSQVVPGITLLLLLVTANASADTVLYDNGPDAFSFSTADYIGFSLIAGDPEAQAVHHFVTEDFTLSAPATIESIVFAQSNAEVGVGPLGPLGVPVPTYVDYSIGTTPFGSNVANGVGVITATDLHQSSGQLHDFSSAFSAYAVLPAGTYYLTLDSSLNFLGTGFSSVAYWAPTDATSGDAMSRAINASTGAILNTLELNNEPSFEILGVLGTPPTSVPEPGTWGLLVGGLLTLALSRRFGRRAGSTWNLR